MSETQSLQVTEKNPVVQATAEELVSPDNAYRPDVDIFYSPDGYLFMVDLPGVKETDIQLEIDEKNTLILKAKNHMTPEGELLFRQTALGNYYRAFSLGDDIDRNQIKARYQLGVLEIHLGRREEVKPKRIEIQING